MPKEGMEASRVVLGPLYAQFLGFVELLRLVEVDLTDHSLKNLVVQKSFLAWRICFGKLCASSAHVTIIRHYTKPTSRVAMRIFFRCSRFIMGLKPVHERVIAFSTPGTTLRQ